MKKLFSQFLPIWVMITLFTGNLLSAQYTEVICLGDSLYLPSLVLPPDWPTNPGYNDCVNLQNVDITATISPETDVFVLSDGHHVVFPSTDTEYTLTTIYYDADDGVCGAPYVHSYLVIVDDSEDCDGIIPNDCSPPADINAIIAEYELTDYITVSQIEWGGNYYYVFVNSPSSSNPGDYQVFDCTGTFLTNSENAYLYFGDDAAYLEELGFIIDINVNAISPSSDCEINSLFYGSLFLEPECGINGEDIYYINHESGFNIALDPQNLEAFDLPIDGLTDGLSVAFSYELTGNESDNCYINALAINLACLYVTNGEYDYGLGIYVPNEGGVPNPEDVLFVEQGAVCAGGSYYLHASGCTSNLHSISIYPETNYEIGEQGFNVFPTEDTEYFVTVTALDEGSGQCVPGFTQIISYQVTVDNSSDCDVANGCDTPLTDFTAFINNVGIGNELLAIHEIYVDDIGYLYVVETCPYAYTFLPEDYPEYFIDEAIFDCEGNFVCADLNGDCQFLGTDPNNVLFFELLDSEVVYVNESGCLPTAPSCQSTLNCEIIIEEDCNGETAYYLGYHYPTLFRIANIDEFTIDLDVFNEQSVGSNFVFTGNVAENCYYDGASALEVELTCLIDQEPILPTSLFRDLEDGVYDYDFTLCSNTSIYLYAPEFDADCTPSIISPFAQEDISISYDYDGESGQYYYQFFVRQSTTIEYASYTCLDDGTFETNNVWTFNFIVDEDECGPEPSPYIYFQGVCPGDVAELPVLPVFEIPCTNGFGESVTNTVEGEWIPVSGSDVFPPTETTEYVASYPLFCNPPTDPDDLAIYNSALEVWEEYDGAMALIEVFFCAPQGDTPGVVGPNGPGPGGNATVNGCTDPNACNYNPNATTNDGSCEYAFANCACDATIGCIDSNATNYNPNANCDDGSCLYNNSENAIFNEYTWLNNVVNQNNCDGETISEFDFGNYSFLSIVTDNETLVYFEDGTLYCTGSSCISAYGLNNPSYTWTCGDVITPTEDPIFDDYSWLYTLVNPSNCNGETISEFDFGNYSFLSIVIDNETLVYFEDGTLYCTGTNCISAYGLNNPTATWTCGETGGNPCANVTDPLSLPWLSEIINCGSDPLGDCIDPIEVNQFVYNGLTYFSLYFVVPGIAESATIDILDCEGNSYCISHIFEDSCPTDIWSAAANGNTIWTSTPNNNQLFIDYPWLNNIVNSNNCGDAVVADYDFGIYSFIAVIENGETLVYFEDGTLYCTGANCISAYGLNNPINTWTCSTTGPDNPLPNYPWLNNLIDPNNCNGDIVNVYDLVSYAFVEIINTSGTYLYFSDGTLYCTNSASLDCAASYGLGAPTDTWTCGMGRPDEVNEHSDISEIAYRSANTNDSNASNLDEELSFNVFPNPSNGQFKLTIQSQIEQEQTVNIYDIQGQLIETFSIETNAAQQIIPVDLAGFGSGMYFIELRSDFSTKVERLIIQ